MTESHAVAAAISALDAVSALAAALKAACIAELNSLSALILAICSDLGLGKYLFIF